MMRCNTNSRSEEVGALLLPDADAAVVSELAGCELMEAGRVAVERLREAHAIQRTPARLSDTFSRSHDPHVHRLLSARQLHASLFRIGVLAVKERGMADSTDAYAAPLVSNLGAFGVARVPIRSEETQLHEFVSAKRLLQLLQKFGRKPLAADL